jgi:heme-degrading monooxygenase HmoA
MVGTMSYLVVFRSRLREGVEAAYLTRAEEVYRIAITMPGLRYANDYAAEDGERVSVIEFDTLEHLTAWRDHPEHLKAQEEGRSRWYASYSIQICKVERSSAYDAATGTWTKGP